MPVSVRRTPFIAPPVQSLYDDLRVPQVRVLSILMPPNPEDNQIDWPLWTTQMLADWIGVSKKSDSIRRALRGLPEGSTSWDAHPGLLTRKLVDEVVLEVEGVNEKSYRITTTGIAAYQAYVAKHGSLPRVRDAAICANERCAVCDKVKRFCICSKVTNTNEVKHEHC